LIGLGVLLLASCSREPVLPPEITTGIAPTDQQPVSLPDSLSSGEVGIADGDVWPRACGLLTDAEITAVLPLGTLVQRRGRDQVIDYITPEYTLLPDGGVISSHPSRTIRVPESGCGIEVELPGVYDRSPYAWLAVSIDIQVQTVGDPETVAHFFDRYRSGVPATDRFGAEECLDGTVPGERDYAIIHLSCRKGRMSIEVSAQGIPPPYFVEVRLAGQPAGADPAVWREWLQQRVLPQFVGAVIRRMS
jgi:hypothetical protein